MTAPSCTNDEFLALWKAYGSPTRVAKHLGVSVSNVYARRNRLAALGHDLATWNDTSERRVVLKPDEGKIDYSIRNGRVIVFSDAHYWPNQRTTMHRALLGARVESREHPASDAGPQTAGLRGQVRRGQAVPHRVMIVLYVVLGILALQLLYTIWENRR